MNVTIRFLHCGDIVVNGDLPFRKSKCPFFKLQHGRKHQVKLPVFAYLIEHPSGLFMIDSGWGADIRKGSKEYLGGVPRHINIGLLEEGQEAAEQLGNLGLHPRNIDYLILTSLDSDHVGGLKRMNAAKHILVSKNEMDNAMSDGKRYDPTLWEGTKITAFEFGKSYFGPWNKAFDLFGDRSVVLTSTPGFTAGATSIELWTGRQYAIFAGDCGFGTPSWMEGILPGYCPDPVKMKGSLLWMKSMAVVPECRGILSTHDTGLAGLRGIELR
ncbi:MAG: MBL fold metallo-hydrolase [Bacteroidales bacterium]|jgi:glyoxylase-like metal-dependent hydrolase (beta-lactamase superfamily II)|nr:MBL fold metallo-hydrolase [Bacteroidales bacterium]MCI2122030.1 MBL fold metallo-hydrolase [Bacteroidales bacterium]MCI2146215.1 MBL fold metallo-hydrolase [Bacteroidales bacterium]